MNPKNGFNLANMAVCALDPLLSKEPMESQIAKNARTRLNSGPLFI